MLEQNYVGDIIEPPEYDWFIKPIQRNEQILFLNTEEKESCYTTVAFIIQDDYPFIKNKCIIQFRNRKICIYEATYKFYKFIKRRNKVIWHGKTEKNFYESKFYFYYEGLENTNELIYYKSIILKYI